MNHSGPSLYYLASFQLGNTSLKWVVNCVAVCLPTPGSFGTTISLQYTSNLSFFSVKCSASCCLLCYIIVSYFKSYLCWLKKCILKSTFPLVIEHNNWLNRQSEETLHFSGDRWLEDFLHLLNMEKATSIHRDLDQDARKFWNTSRSFSDSQ